MSYIIYCEYVKYHLYSSLYITHTFIYKTNLTVPLNFQAWSTTPLTHWRLMTPQACHCHDGRNPQDQNDLSFLLGFPKWKRLLVACCGPLWKWRYDMFLRTASTKIQNVPNAFRWPSTTWSKRPWARQLPANPIRCDSRLPSTQQAQVTRDQP